MKNKKGFTLIELLAVIVILAIIALIAVPIVLNMINNAKKSAAISSTYGYIEAVEMYQGMQDVNELDNFEEGQYNVSTNTTINDKTYNSVNSYIKMKGKKATGGKIHITSSGKVDTATLCMDSYLINYQNNEASIISNDCGDIDLTILFGTNSNEWETSKELTITYPNKNYDKYYKLESGKASIDGNQITVGQEIKAESNEIKITLEENSKVTAWLVKNNTKSSETSYEEKKIDNVELPTITSATAAGYPLLTSNGVESGLTLTIEYEAQEGTSAYYSVDNGSTWTKYTNQVRVTSSNIKAKLMRDNSKRSTEPVNVTVSIPTDAIAGEAYDGDMESYTGYVYSDSNNNARYIMIDSSSWNKKIHVDWWCRGDGNYSYLTFLGSNDETLATYSTADSTDTSIDIKIPKGSVRVKYYLKNFPTTTLSKLYEIRMVLEITPYIRVAEMPIFTSTGVTTDLDPASVTIEYKNSTQNLYKIDDGEWQNYNGKITLAEGETVYAKAIVGETESEIVSYTNNGTPTKVLEQNAFDDDVSSYYNGGNKAYRYIKVDPTVWEKTMSYNLKGYTCVYYYRKYPASDTETSTRINGLGCNRNTSKSGIIPEDTYYIQVYFNESGGMYDMRLTD